MAVAQMRSGRTIRSSKNDRFLAFYTRVSSCGSNAETRWVARKGRGKRRSTRELPQDRACFFIECIENSISIPDVYLAVVNDRRTVKTRRARGRERPDNFQIWHFRGIGKRGALLLISGALGIVAKCGPVPRAASERGSCRKNCECLCKCGEFHLRLLSGTI